MSSVVDRIFGWFSGARKEDESVAEAEQLDAQEEEHAPEFRSEEYVNGLNNEHVREEERVPDFNHADEVHDDHEKPEEHVDEMERASAFRHEDYFPPMQEQDESEVIDSMKSMWLRKKKEES